MDVTLTQALAWRLDRHFLRTGSTSVHDVVRRLCGVPAWLGDADLAVRRRLQRPAPGALTTALETGEVLRTYAYRGATYLLAADDAGVYLAVRGAGRQWLRRSWQTHYDLGPHDWDALRDTVRSAVADGPVSRDGLVDAIAGEPRFSHLRARFADSGDTLLKALAWQGDLCFGPSRDGRTTYQSPRSSPHWQGLPDVDDAGRRAVLLHLDGHGPATRDNLHHALVDGLSAGRRRLETWLADLGDQVVEVRVDGHPMLHLREHLDALAGAEVDPDEVTLLPGHDQWVLGPGTADERLVPPEHRGHVTRGANLVLHEGRVAGTWRLAGSDLAVTRWPGQPALPEDRLLAEAGRLGGLVDTDLTLTPPDP